MLLAAMRLNIPTIFVSGGPMESGEGVEGVVEHRLDLVDAMVMAVDDSVSDTALAQIEKNACPTCGSCAGMFTANSMNCLNEAIGLALPGNGTTLATQIARKELFLQAGKRIVGLAKRYYEQDDEVRSAALYCHQGSLRERYGVGCGYGRFDQYRAALPGYCA